MAAPGGRRFEQHHLRLAPLSLERVYQALERHLRLEPGGNIAGLQSLHPDFRLGELSGRAVE